jgi:putative salt-induced outer membrane protein YdiY
MRRTFWLFYFLCCVQAWAGEVVLKNGDRLTGKVIRMDKTSLELESELLGKISMPWVAVVKIESETPVYVSFSDSEVVKGQLSMIDGRIQVLVKDAAAQNYPKDAVRAIRSEEEQRAFMSRPKVKQPGLFDLWGGSVDTAISITRGNADTKTLNLGIRTARITPRNNVRLYVTTMFSESSTDKQTTRFAEAIRGGSRYEVNLGPRFFTFGFTDLEHDQFQGLESRFVGGGGVGMNVIKTAKTSFQVFSGGSSNREEFQNSPRRYSREFVAGNDLTRQLTAATSVTQSFIIYPNLSSRGQYRINFDSSIVTRLNSWLAWHVTTSNRYTSNPAAGKHRNDLLLTTGIRFVHRGEALQNVEARPELRRR